MAYATLAWLPWAVGEYQTHVLTTCSYYVILAVGWNLLAGFTGQFSLAHHTFAGIGAYTSALLVLYARGAALRGHRGRRGGGGGDRVGASGTLCLRMRAIYLALATWAFAESVRLLITVEYQVTRGDLGLATPFLFGTPRPTPYYSLFLGLAIVAARGRAQSCGLANRLVHARDPRRRGSGLRHGRGHVQVETVRLRDLRRLRRRSPADSRAATSACSRRRR